jgi:thiol-disulfide isomerase/thioredoxin
MVAPFFEQLAAKYPDVKFIKVDVDEAQDIASEQGVRAMPTFKYFSNSSLLETLQGADQNKLEQLVISLKASCKGGDSFGGSANIMGGSSGLDANAARLARFGGAAAAGSSASASAPAPTPAVAKASTVGNVGQGDDEDEALAKAIALSMEPEPEPKAVDTDAKADTKTDDKATSSATASPAYVNDADTPIGDELVPLPVNLDLLKELMSMGYSDIRARKGLHFGGGAIDAAISWISSNETATNIDDEFLVKASEANKKPLTAEEVEAKMIELKALAKKRRDERLAQEKKDNIRIEKERRERDQKNQQTQAERDIMQRKRENEKLKKEKIDAKNEKQRILDEIARDKAIRAKNNGVIPSVLGIGGYNPSAIQYEQGGEGKSDDPNASKASTLAVINPEEIIEKSIQNLLRYKTRGDGGNALKLLGLFVKNIVEKPTEIKYRSISTESNAYKTKIAPFVGGTNVLKSLGFEKNDDGNKLVLNIPDDDITSFLPLFSNTLAKLQGAEAKFKADNP